MPPEPLTREQWTTEFAHELLTKHRPEVSPTHAHRVATYEWAARKDIAPAEAAKQWAAEQAARRKTK
jgi:hypothetical protein